MDGQDQEDLVVRDTHLVDLEVLFDKTFLKQQSYA
jgi:hypothetical protein